MNYFVPFFMAFVKTYVHLINGFNQRIKYQECRNTISPKKHIFASELVPYRIHFAYCLHFIIDYIVFDTINGTVLYRGITSPQTTSTLTVKLMVLLMVYIYFFSHYSYLLFVLIKRSGYGKLFKKFIFKYICKNVDKLSLINSLNGSGASHP